MRRLVVWVALGATALVLMDYIAVGTTASTSTISPQSTDVPGVVVNRAVKGDRQDQGGTTVQLKLNRSPQSTTPTQREAPRPAKHQPKMLEGCELAVSPLAESARSGTPALCLS